MAEKLGEMLAEMPCAHWTRASIEDAFLDWFWTHGRLPSTRALDNMPGLPCHGTIRKCLGAPYAQFAEAFLRRWGDLLHLPGYGWTSAEALRTLFLREYERLRRPPPRATTPAAKRARRARCHRPGADARGHMGGAACAFRAHALLSAPRGDGSARAGLRRGRRFPSAAPGALSGTPFRTTKRASRRHSSALMRERGRSPPQSERRAGRSTAFMRRLLHRRAHF